jgi:hypothetical protein
MTADEIRAAMEAHVNSIPETPPGPIPRRERPLDKTSMSYWFPLIEAAGLPVPMTKFVEMTDTCRRMIWDIFDGKDSGDANAEPFFDQIADAAGELGYPCFLRTDHTSDKHSWKRTCFLPSQDVLPAHVCAIAEFSECADMMGMPWDIWAVRELLPTIPHGTCPNYGDFPVCREFRFFVDDGKIRCSHPYWPLAALERGGWNGDFEELCRVPNEGELRLLAERAGAAVGGSWSIDILETKRGWMVTDMAEAHKSYHWEGCKADGAIPEHS